VRTGQARKRDANEAAIVKALRQIGAEVFPLSGRGIPDVLVRYRGSVYAFEIKSATGKQTDAQLDTQWPVIRSIEDALFELGVR
jgi:Holliday junction resolvase